MPLGLIAGAYWPGIDPETIGAFRLDTYLYAYFVMCVPTLFVLGAPVLRAGDDLRARCITTYVVALIVLMMYFLSAAYLARAEFRDIMSWLDPFALAPFRHATEHWSPNDRNTLLPPFLGPMLKNRVLWMTVAFALLAWTWRSFRQDKPSDAKAPKRKAAEPAETAKAHSGAVVASLPRPATDARSLGWGPLLTLARFDALSVLRSPAFFVLVGIAFVNAIVGLWYAGDDNVTIARPVTRLMINVLNEQFSLFPLIIAAYYAGELVWRDRERRVHEFIDATPAADWAFVVPKIIAIAIVLFTMDLISVGRRPVRAGAQGLHQLRVRALPVVVHGAVAAEHAAVRGARGVHPDAGAEQVRRPARDAADPRRAAGVPALRLGEPSLPVRQHFAGSADGHERAGSSSRGTRRGIGCTGPRALRFSRCSRTACGVAVRPRR